MTEDHRSMDLVRDTILETFVGAIDREQLLDRMIGIVEQSGRALVDDVCFGPAEETTGKWTLAHNLDDQAKLSGSLVAMGEDYEVAYWTQTFGVTGGKLQLAVDAVGNGADQVEAWLKTH